MATVAETVALACFTVSGSERLTITNGKMTSQLYKQLRTAVCGLRPWRKRERVKEEDVVEGRPQIMFWFWSSDQLVGLVDGSSTSPSVSVIFFVCSVY